MPIEVPPLRHRSEDIPALVSHFVGVLGNGPGMAPKPFSDGALLVLQRRRWPGNVRELRNAVERLLILASGPEIVEADIDTVLPPDIKLSMDPEKFASEAGDRNINEFRLDAERAYIVAQLHEQRWNIAETARVLGMTRSNLYNRMERFGISRESS
jgi:two-component system nitrogen regulation response regulator NtrX